jgi:hypothetical protein
VSWAPQLRELLGVARVHRTLGLSAAVGNLAGRAPDEDRDTVVTALQKEFPTLTVAALTLGPQR